ncbi:uncharacterized protein ACNLHF_003130 [Anomaloglossus baeobatrachus]
MESLLEKMMARVGAADGEEWLKRCLAPVNEAAEVVLDPASDLAGVPARREELLRPGEGEDVRRSLRKKRKKSDVYSPPASCSQRSGGGRKRSASARGRRGDGRKTPETSREAGVPARGGSGASRDRPRSRRDLAASSGRDSQKARRAIIPEVAVGSSAPAVVAGYSGDPGSLTGLYAPPAPLQKSSAGALAAATQVWSSTEESEEDVAASGGRQPQYSALDGPGSGGHGPMVIWLVGHSFIHWAQRRAACRSYTENLSFQYELINVFWYGIRGLKFSNLLGTLKGMLLTHPYPDLIILHIGGNDLGKIKTLDLLSNFRRDFALLKNLFPYSALIFSEIVPRLRMKTKTYEE